jgi:hypothetical protein
MQEETPHARAALLAAADEGVRRHARGGRAPQFLKRDFKPRNTRKTRKKAGDHMAEAGATSGRNIGHFIPLHHGRQCDKPVRAGRELDAPARLNICKLLVFIPVGAGIIPV